MFAPQIATQPVPPQVHQQAQPPRLLLLSVVVVVVIVFVAVVVVVVVVIAVVVGGVVVVVVVVLLSFISGPSAPSPASPDGLIVETGHGTDQNHLEYK